MDPTSTWARLTDAIVENDPVETFEAARDLQFWIERAGSYPTQWGANAGAWRTFLARLTAEDE